MIIASNPWLVKEFAFDPPVPCNVHAAHGPDGACRLLLVHHTPRNVKRGYGRLVINSGDYAPRPFRHSSSESSVPIHSTSLATGVFGERHRRDLRNSTASAQEP